MYIRSKSAEDAFHKILDVLESDGIESKPRGMRIRELINVNVEIENPRDRIVTCPERKFSSSYAFGELAWYLSGRNDLETMKYYSSRMENGSDDGETLNSAYGYRIFAGKHPKIGFNQWDNAVNLLSADRDTRQAIIHLHTANDKKTKDEVCTLSLQFFIRNGKLDMITTMRSNDIVLGFTYDVFQFTMLQEMMLNELNKKLLEGKCKKKPRKIEMGKYYHNVGSMHIYLDGFYGNGNFEFLRDGHTKNELLPMQPFSFTYEELEEEIVSLERTFRKSFYEFESMSLCDFGLIKKTKEQIKDYSTGNFSNDDKLLNYIQAAFLIKYTSKVFKACQPTSYKFKNEIISCLNYSNETYAEILSLQCNFEKGGKMIIVEGPDAVGKTTFINEFLKTENKESFRKRHFISVKDFTSFDFTTNYLSVIRSNQNTICDRFIFSELIYSEEFRRGEDRGYNHLSISRVINGLVDKKNLVKLFFIVATTLEEANMVMKRMDESDKNTFDAESFLRINRNYKAAAKALIQMGFDVTVLRPLQNGEIKEAHLNDEGGFC